MLKIPSIRFCMGIRIFCNLESHIADLRFSVLCNLWQAKAQRYRLEWVYDSENIFVVHQRLFIIVK